MSLTVNLCDIVNRHQDLPEWETLGLSLSTPITDDNENPPIITASLSEGNHILHIGSKQCSLERLIGLVAAKIWASSDEHPPCICHLTLQERRWAHLTLQTLESLYLATQESSLWTGTMRASSSHEQKLLRYSLERIRIFSQEAFNSFPSDVRSQLTTKRINEGIVLDDRNFQDLLLALR